jgi:DNA ligase (NAD+)
MEHFFKMLRHVDLFGTASIERMYGKGIRKVTQIYKLDAKEFENMGFGPKQAENLVEQLSRSRAEKIEDWRFLAAFGVFRLGPGNCEKLLGHYRLEEIFDLSEEQIEEVEGFAKKTATIAVKGLKNTKPLFDELYGLGFNLERTPYVLQIDQPLTPISGKQIVFTGSMTQGSRADMEKEAKSLGAKVGKAVTGKTDILVTGENVGAAKMNEARAKDVRILSEEDYRKLLAPHP